MRRCRHSVCMAFKYVVPRCIFFYNCITLNFFKRDVGLHLMSPKIIVTGHDIFFIKKNTEGIYLINEKNIERQVPMPKINEHCIPL